jgi:transcriptional regulator of arginine metabolism
LTLKEQRRALILGAVSEQAIATQEQLLTCLAASGVEATQATVSRDIRDLGLKKKSKKGGVACYAPATAENKSTHRYALLENSVLSAEAVGNMVCVRCGGGLAQGACAALDEIALKDVAGSLAGEDTIFLLCRSDTAARRVREEIDRYAAKPDN